MKRYIIGAASGIVAAGSVVLQVIALTLAELVKGDRVEYCPYNQDVSPEER